MAVSATLCAASANIAADPVSTPATSFSTADPGVRAERHQDRQGALAARLLFPHRTRLGRPAQLGSASVDIAKCATVPAVASAKRSSAVVLTFSIRSHALW